jgi:TM2 domain-containing membrane protein YozV
MKLRYKIYISLWLLFISTVISAQQIETKSIRIVDTLTAQEKANRNPVILKAELDSLIKQYHSALPKLEIKEPVKEAFVDLNGYLLLSLLAIVLLLATIIFLLFGHQKKINQVISGYNEKINEPFPRNGKGHKIMSREKKGHTSKEVMEEKIAELDAELNKLTKENEGLAGVVKEYNGIQHEFDSIKQGILKTYKVKNYPGYDKLKNDTQVMQGVLQTENSLAVYAYEKYVKPLLAIADSNKNNPAKISKADQEKLMDMLISISFLYIEYLYLRVNELSIGGKMVERIHGLNKGNDPDVSLLKKLDTEFGSRALVVKIALEKASLNQLSYPVFDETNLNIN